MPEANTPAQPVDPVEPDDTFKVDTAKHRPPNVSSKDEPTPILDEVTEYLSKADEADITHFTEDEDPTQFAGDEVTK